MSHLDHYGRVTFDGIFWFRRSRGRGRQLALSPTIQDEPSSRPCGRADRADEIHIWRFDDEGMICRFKHGVQLALS